MKSRVDGARAERRTGNVGVTLLRHGNTAPNTTRRNYFLYPSSNCAEAGWQTAELLAPGWWGHSRVSSRTFNKSHSLC